MPTLPGLHPELAKWYTQDLKSKGLEIVFVSSDKEEAAFKEYFGEMPWLALDYADRETKNKLSKLYKVQGIPALIVLDGEGKLVTKDGREAVSKDPTGEMLPWIPPKPKDLMGKMKLSSKDGAVSLEKAMEGKKALALYFSAHWCPPCRGFTPELAKWYTQDLKAKGLEVIFVSSDKEEAAFKEYFGEMPWLALDYSERHLKEELSTAFGVQGIPSLVVLDSDFNLVTKDGRSRVSADPTGDELPWHPKPVGSLEHGPGDIQEVPTFICFCETAAEEEKASIEEAMASVSLKYMEKQKQEEAEYPDIAFIIVKSVCDLGDRLRSMFNMSASEQPVCTLIDIPEDGAYYVGEPQKVTKEIVEDFLSKYKSGALERKQLQ